jgi:hypothetical protein
MGRHHGREPPRHHVGRLRLPAQPGVRHGHQQDRCRLSDRLRPGRCQRQGGARARESRRDGARDGVRGRVPGAGRRHRLRTPPRADAGAGAAARRNDLRRAADLRQPADEPDPGEQHRGPRLLSQHRSHERSGSRSRTSSRVSRGSSPGGSRSSPTGTARGWRTSCRTGPSPSTSSPRRPSGRRSRAVPCRWRRGRSIAGFWGSATTSSS